MSSPQPVRGRFRWFRNRPEHSNGEGSYIETHRAAKVEFNAREIRKAIPSIDGEEGFIIEREEGGVQIQIAGNVGDREKGRGREKKFPAVISLYRRETRFGAASVYTLT